MLIKSTIDAEMKQLERAMKATVEIGDITPAREAAAFQLATGDDQTRAWLAIESCVGLETPFQHRIAAPAASKSLRDSSPGSR